MIKQIVVRILTGIILLCHLHSYSQFKCPDSLIYTFKAYATQSIIVSWDPFAGPWTPVTFTNQPVTDVGLFGGIAGLALSPNLNNGTLSPTFYTTQYGGLFYWSGVSWINTNVTISNDNIYGLVGCGNSIYGLSSSNPGSYKVHKYTPPSPVSTVLTLTTNIAGSIVSDCNCNFYLLSSSTLYKYDPNGTLLTTYTVNGLPFVTSLATRFAIIGNTIYVIGIGPAQPGNVIYKGKGTIIGNSITTSSLAGLSINGTAVAITSCPFSLNMNVAATIASNTIGCNPPTASLAVNTTVTPLNYNWSGPGLMAPVGNGPTVNVNAPGTYSCYVKDGFCADTILSLVTTVTTNTTLVTPAILPGANLCFEPNMNLFSSLSSPQYSYTWTGPNILGANTSTAIGIQGPGTYSLKVTEINNGCVGSVASSILPVPLLNFGISSPTLCVYSTNGKNIAILSYSGALNYTLLVNSGFSIQLIPSQPVILSQTIPYSTIGSTGAATLYGTNGVCTTSVITNFSVLPVTKITATSSKSLVCNGTSVTLVADGAVSYSWTPLNKIKSINNNLVSVDILGSTQFSVVGLDIYGCNSAPEIISVNIFPLHAGQLIFKDPICSSDCKEFTFVPSIKVGNKIYTNWTLETKSFPQTEKINACFPMEGPHKLFVTLTDSVHQCANSLAFTLNVYPKPKADFNYLPEKPVENLEEVQFISNSLGEQQNEWNWFVYKSGLNKAKGERTAFKFQDAGIYSVALITKNKWGCADTSIQAIHVEEDFLFYMPNSFTPNDDLKNELFLPVTRGVKQIDFSIFNQWGQLVFKTNSISEGWDGMFKGNPCQEDIYIWKVELSTKLGASKKFNGHVLLMR
ncbi:T9SS type B sorting domain-containing protein [Aurantibacillus circumpalustris]|uniref:T9SS type B sorting domain-containing protein n=1 Tax=Aurantibacillus circumpalustris TaxID=3036359 RepID=UPI00295C214B|nr:T9SS type B sorting domain-containing protein [Aurantibacillus circumpalustris]